MILTKLLSTFFCQKIKDATSDFSKQLKVRIRLSGTRGKINQRCSENLAFFCYPSRTALCIVRGEGYMIFGIKPSNEFTPAHGFELKSAEVGDSEMQHLDFAHASGMLEHFVGEGRLYLTIRGRKYTPEFSFNVGNSQITQKSVQTEVDAGYEGEEVVVLVEGKNTKVKNTIIRQLYYPYRKWAIDTGKRVIPMFFEKIVMSTCSGCMNLQNMKTTTASVL